MFPAPLSRDHPNFLSKQMVWILKSSWSNSVTLKSTTKKQHIFRNNIEFWRSLDHGIFPIYFRGLSKKKQRWNTGAPPATLLAEFRGGTLNLETEGEKTIFWCTWHVATWQFVYIPWNAGCWLVVEPPHLKNIIYIYRQIGSFPPGRGENKNMFETTTLE